MRTINVGSERYEGNLAISYVGSFPALHSHQAMQLDFHWSTVFIPRIAIDSLFAVFIDSFHHV